MDNPWFFPRNTISLHGQTRRAVLQSIRFTPGGISRAELARQLGLTRSAISLLVSDLIQSGLVREATSSPSTGGRRAIILELNPHFGVILGVDLGATHLRLVATDFLARVLCEKEVPLNVSQGPELCLNLIDQYLNSFLGENKIKLDDVLSIGMGVPGPVVVEAGVVSAPPIMPGWDDFPIRSRLERMWGRPISLNNDADLGAVGEWTFGAGRFKNDMIYIKVGTGIGAGLILGGRLYSGASGLAGEIGHLTIQEDGPLCTCGNRGCLEVLASGPAIANQATQAVREGKRTQLSRQTPVESITAREVGQAACQGDLVAQQIIAEAGTHIGIALAGIINLVNPSIIVIGGGVAQMGDLLLEPMRHAASERSLPPAAQAVSITSAMLGRRSSCMGAVAQAIECALDLQTGESSDRIGGENNTQIVDSHQVSLVSNPSIASLETG